MKQEGCDLTGETPSWAVWGEGGMGFWVAGSRDKRWKAGVEVGACLLAGPSLGVSLCR